jgi:hypothetical protein
MNTAQQIKAFSTDQLESLIIRNADIQRQNHPDSPIAASARKANRPLMAEMATRKDAPRVR